MLHSREIKANQFCSWYNDPICRGRDATAPWQGCCSLEAYRVLDHILITGLVVNIDRYRSQGGDLGGERVEERIVLPERGC
jgi:hypothetical protein